MPYDDNTGIFTVDNGTTGAKKIAADGRGDLQRALGRVGVMKHYLLIGDVNDQGQRVNKINKFAKFKPFQYAGVILDRYSDTNSKRLAELIATNYGFKNGSSGNSNIPTFTNWSTLIAGTPQNYTTPWAYYPPTSYYRVFDFDGYISRVSDWELDNSDDTTKYSPFGIVMYLPGSGRSIGATDVISYDVIKHNAVLDNYILYLDDFTNLGLNLSNFYYGLLFVKDGANGSRLFVSNNKPTDVDTGGGSLHIPIEIPGTSTLPTGVYTIAPVLISTAPSSQDGQWISSQLPSGATVVSIDGYNFPGLEITAQPHGVLISCNITITSSGIDGVVTITNRTGQRIQINEVFVYIVAEEVIDGNYQYYGLDYYQKYSNAVDGWVGTNHTPGADIYGNNYPDEVPPIDDRNKIVVRYQNVSNTNFYVGNGGTSTLNFSVAHTTDDLGNIYNSFTTATVLFRYTTDGGTVIWQYV